MSLIEGAAGDPGIRAFHHGLAGRIALAQGRPADAAGQFRQAIFLESQRAQPFRLPTWYLLLGEADAGQRSAHVLQAYRALERIRPLLPITDPVTEESLFATRMRPVFEAAVQVQLERGAQGDETARIAGAQTIIEAFRQAEIQSTFGNDCVPPSDPVTPADLAAGEIILYPILLPDRVELIYATPGGNGAPAIYRRIGEARPIGRAAVARMVEQVANGVAYGTDQSWRDQAAALYELLIRPIEAQLAPGATLVIVPDGPLRALPFAALLDGDGQFLVERARLAIAPALSYSQAGTPRDGEPVVVAASLQKDVSLPAGFFPALAGAGNEARVAAGTRAGTLIQDFQRGDLEQALSHGRVDILHLATHAAFNGRSDRSFIVADGEAIPISDLRGLIGEGRARGDSLDLIVLSACETAVGDDQATMGLAGTAVQSGANSALASLWQVNDAGTVELMRNFYAAYRQGQSKAEALRSAQLALLHAGGDNADPYVWSAFTLLGAWR
jgi:CHAT domain-containing protein